nr:hypothetical protein [Micromonospora zingiberis]
MVAGVLAAMCLGGGVVGYLVYDRVTTPDRSTPDVVVVAYLQATLISPDPNRAALYTCGSSLSAVEAFRQQIEEREQDLEVKFSINLEHVIVSQTSPDDAIVTLNIRRSAYIDGVPQSLTDSWRFQVVNRHDWRVCGGEPVI